VDWSAACFAFVLERKERWRLLWWLFLQRFCYRQGMYYVMIKSVATAVNGAVGGWGKLERKATGEAQPWRGWAFFLDNSDHTRTIHETPRRDPRVSRVTLWIALLVGRRESDHLTVRPFVASL